jgi:DNA-directed RNA polymerase specialized sigma subunit
MSTLSPIQEFLKYAGKAQVRAHQRNVDGKTVHVRPHSRDVEDAASREADKREADRAEELRLWKKWMDGGKKPEDLGPLLNKFGGMIRSQFSAYKGKVKLVPDSVMEAEFKLQFVKALESYDPSKGTLGTYVYRYLSKAKRYITERQNIGRIPENRIYKIKAYTTARDEFLEKNEGRIPTHQEMLAALKPGDSSWTLNDVKRMDAELRGDLVSQNFEDDPYSIYPSKEDEIIKLYRAELEGQELEVYDFLIGGGGKERIKSTGEIAKRLGIPDYQVSRHKRSIMTGLKKYLDEDY